MASWTASVGPPDDPGRSEYIGDNDQSQRWLIGVIEKDADKADRRGQRSIATDLSHAAEELNLRRDDEWSETIDGTVYRLRESAGGEGAVYRGQLSWLPEGGGRTYSAEGLIFDWNGSLTVNVRYPQGNDFDVWTYMEMPTPEEVEESIRSYLGERRHEENPDRAEYKQSAIDTKEKLAGYRHAVQRPGKFEGERDYVPYFWEIGLEFGADAESEDRATGLTRYTFNVNDRDRRLFTGLAGRDAVHLVETSDGFVQETGLV